VKHRLPKWVALAVVVLGVSVVEPLRGQILTQTLSPFLQFNLELMKQLEEPVIDEALNPPGKFSGVKPQEFDPGKTHLVQAAWLHGIGCPTDARIAIPNATFTGIERFDPYTDPACVVGDANDLRNEGLLLAKTGPTENFASATAELINVKGIILTELGYDIRKQGGSVSPLGSHCGAGSPRFNVVTDTGTFFIGCNSPTPFPQTLGNGWTRLRWTVAVPGTVRRIVIVLDEGQDIGPDFFGAAVLDNIDVNGKLVGRGATDAN
jgi:hypothetical protein